MREWIGKIIDWLLGEPTPFEPAGLDDPHDPQVNARIVQQYDDDFTFLEKVERDEKMH